MSVTLAGMSRCNRRTEAGIATNMEAVIAFVDWADKTEPRLTPDLIQTRFGCSRATSYRWFNAYRAIRSRRQA